MLNEEKHLYLGRKAPRREERFSRTASAPRCMCAPLRMTFREALIMSFAPRNGECLMEFKNIITIEPGKRGGKPCIRGVRITVYDVLEYLASGMTEEEILRDFPYLTREDILASLGAN